MLQYENSKSIMRLEAEVKYLREQNTALLKRVGVGIELIKNVDSNQFNPIPGYNSLADRIKEKEKNSRELYEKQLKEETNEEA
jgi:hypothetical protein